VKRCLTAEASNFCLPLHSEIREIRVISVFSSSALFSRNSGRKLAQYISERPEMTPQGFGIKQGKNKQQKRKSKMKNLSITFGAILLELGCFCLSPAVKAGDERPFCGRSANRGFMAC